MQPQLQLLLQVATVVLFVLILVLSTVLLLFVAGKLFLCDTAIKEKEAAWKIQTDKISVILIVQQLQWQNISTVLPLLLH